MLYVYIDKPVPGSRPGLATVETQIIEWHIGMPNPNLGSRGDIIYVTEVQADGDELEAIDRRFIGVLPTAKHPPVVRWFGDHARFIAANL